MKSMALPRSHPDQEPEGKQDGALVYISKARDERAGLPISHLLLSSKSSPLLILLVLPLFQELKTERKFFFLSLIADCSLLQMVVPGTIVIQLLFFQLYRSAPGSLPGSHSLIFCPMSEFSFEETQLLFSQPLSFGQAPSPPTKAQEYSI